LYFIGVKKEDAKLRKNERNAKEKLSFLHFRVIETSAKPKLRKIESKTKGTRFSFIYMTNNVNKTVTGERH